MTHRILLGGSFAVLLWILFHALVFAPRERLEEDQALIEQQRKEYNQLLGFYLECVERKIEAAEAEQQGFSGGIEVITQ